MTRTGLVVALVLAAAVGVLFGLRPALDLRLSHVFFDLGGLERDFGLRHAQALAIMRDASTWLVAAIAAPAFLAPLFKVLLPGRAPLVTGRAAVFLVATLALAPGLMANVVLKEHWGRARPIQVTEFGGVQRFTAWWDPRGACPANCSFVSGEVAGAAWTLAPAALAPPHWRALAYAGALAFTAVAAANRMAAGAHFFTDVFFAAVFTFVIVWVMHGIVYRRRRRPDLPSSRP
jgi:membrane-associated PAP2 superfamily phosphatase